MVVVVNQHIELGLRQLLYGRSGHSQMHIFQVAVDELLSMQVLQSLRRLDQLQAHV
jgi:hypothetical protein